ncbi:MAG: DEAD/DEAH box helicase [Selenomonadaceae bacterium]|nr:DEAD/DEAH box helicase [Selenomonadaceae bacterium]
MNDYEEICGMAHQCGFKDFTEIQEKSFRNENFYDIEKWLFIVGATGAGKTLIALLSYFYEQRRHYQKGRPYKMLFSVPYRALSSQKLDEIFNACKMLNLNLKILQSTSEHTRDDEKILAGETDIAVIINEKIFMFAASDEKFLSRYNLLVLDEIALTQDPVRGVKTDFVMLKARQEKNLRVITLGTPFFNWGRYAKNFNFTVIREEHRPIEIKEVPIFKSVTIGNLPKSKFFIDIFKKHLLNGERIIIFLNSRQEVQKLSRVLPKKLESCGVLQQWIAAEKCNDYILNEIQAFDDTTLYGTMETEDYNAFSYGIAFHNANMPPSLRYFIERDFMNAKGHIKIIFSTETLAYGINSNADVVIIPGMFKTDYALTENNEVQRHLRFLKPNEYMNYAGRAGRLDPLLPLSAQKVEGYVYPIIPTDAQNLWNNLHEEIKTPEISISGYFNSDADVQAFFILSFFSSKNILTAAQISDLLKQLPRDENNFFDEIKFVDKPLNDLLTRRLIYIVNSDDDGEEDFVAEYKATGVGKKIAGFVIKLADFDKMLNDIPSYMSEEKIFEADLFHSIITTKGILYSAKINIGELSDKDNDSDTAYLPKTIAAMKKIFNKNRRRMTADLYDEVTKKISSYEKRLKTPRYAEIVKDQKFIIMRILAAILIWLYGECSPKFLYDAFKIHYEQMRRLMEIISYRLDMIRFSLDIAPGKNPSKTLRRELGLPRLNEFEKFLNKISAEIMYQPSTELCNLLKVRHFDMHKLQKLKSVETEYDKLIKFSAGEKMPEGYVQKLLRKMQHWLPTWRDVFLKNFGGILDEKR